MPVMSPSSWGSVIAMSSVTRLLHQAALSGMFLGSTRPKSSAYTSPPRSSPSGPCERPASVADRLMPREGPEPCSRPVVACPSAARCPPICLVSAALAAALAAVGVAAVPSADGLAAEPPDRCLRFLSSKYKLFLISRSSMKKDQTGERRKLWSIDSSRLLAKRCIPPRMTIACW